MTALGFWSSSSPDSKSEGPATPTAPQDILLHEVAKLCVFGSYNNPQIKNAISEFFMFIQAIALQCGVVNALNEQKKAKSIKQAQKFESRLKLKNRKKLKLLYCGQESFFALPLAELIAPQRIADLIAGAEFTFSEGVPPNWSDMSPVNLSAFFAYYQSAWDNTERSLITADDEKGYNDGQLYLKWYKEGVPDKFVSRLTYIQQAISCVQKSVVNYGYMDCSLATDAMLLHAIWLGYPGACVRFHNNDDSEDLNVFVLDSKGKTWPEPGCIVANAWSSPPKAFCWAGDNISAKNKQLIFKLEAKEIPIFRRALEKAGYAKWHESPERIKNIAAIKELVKGFAALREQYLLPTLGNDTPTSTP